jgi:hypothetical protein
MEVAMTKMTKHSNAISRLMGRVVACMIIILVTGTLASGCNGKGSAEETQGGFLSSLFGPKTVDVVVPAGTTFTVAVNHALSSESNSPGDPVQARVVGNITTHGKLVVRDGAPAYGVVTVAERSARVKGRARLALKITSIETLDGRKDVESSMNAGTLVAPGTKKRDAAVIGGGTAAGAVLGEIIGDKPGLGAVIGGAAGTGVVLSTRGKEVHVPQGTRVKFKLQTPLEVEVPVEQPAPVAMAL